MLISSILKNIPVTKETQIIKNIDDDLFLKRGYIVVGKDTFEHNQSIIWNCKQYFTMG